MPQLGPLEIAVVLLIALLVFGPNRLPELARQVGGVMRELRRVQQNIRQDLHELVNDVSSDAAAPPTLPPKDGEAPVATPADDTLAGGVGTPGSGAEPATEAPANPVAEEPAPESAPASVPPLTSPPAQRPLAASAAPSPPPPPTREPS